MIGNFHRLTSSTSSMHVIEACHVQYYPQITHGFRNLAKSNPTACNKTKQMLIVHVRATKNNNAAAAAAAQRDYHEKQQHRVKKCFFFVCVLRCFTIIESGSHIITSQQPTCSIAKNKYRRKNQNRKKKQKINNDLL